MSGFYIAHLGGLFYAQSPEDVLGLVFGENYAVEAGAEQRAEQRQEIAFRAATMAQGIIALAASDKGDFDPEIEDEETLTAIFSDRSLPAPLLAWEWGRPELPLVLTSAAVELRRRHFPTSLAVMVVDSRTSIRLVYSLASLGVFELSAL